MRSIQPSFPFKQLLPFQRVPLLCRTGLEVPVLAFRIGWDPLPSSRLLDVAQACQPARDLGLFVLGIIPAGGLR